MSELFPRITSRFRFVHIFKDQALDFDFEHTMDIFEDNIFGIFLQYHRIIANLQRKQAFSDSQNIIDQHISTQISLDIYFYTLIWDKLIKIFEKLKHLLNVLQKGNQSVPETFKDSLKIVKSKFEHLFGEINIEARNEYEHPSLSYHQIGSIMVFGALMIDSNGNINAHVGKDQFISIRKDHLDRLHSFWIELTDIFLLNFTDKKSSSSIMEARQFFEHHIDDFILEYKQLCADNKPDDASDFLGQLLSAEIALQSEGFPLSIGTIQKFHSVFFKQP